MDPGDWIALAAAAVALGAMGVAIWQAVEARRSRQVAKDQAASAATEAAAAHEANNLAHQSLEEARKANELAQAALEHDRRAIESAEARANAERHARSAPDFTIEWWPGMGWAGTTARFQISYEGGPPRLDRLTLSIPPDSSVAVLRAGDEHGLEVPEIELHNLTRTGRTEFFATIGEGTAILFSVTAFADGVDWGEQPVHATARR